VSLRDHARAGLPLAELRIVDIHGHAGPYAEFPVHGAWSEGLLRTMDAVGIEALLIAPHIGIGPDDAEANRLAAEMAHASGGRLLPYCIINPNRAMRHIRAQLEQHVAGGGAVGIKLHPSLHQAPIAHPRYEPAFEYAARARVPILVHTWEGCPHCSPQALGGIAARFPEVSFVMGHSGGTPGGYAAAAQVGAEVPNVWFDITGSQARPGALERLISQVGAGRVLFGSDMPFLDPRPKLGQVLFAEVSDEAKRAVLGGNARLLLGLPSAPDSGPGGSAR
jgi:predicted TIM-barrel fold metal-dependent hydrolase